MSLFTVASQMEQENRSFAVVQIIECRGSTPRHSGTMLVADNGDITGTIGGGMVERIVIEETLQAIKEGSSRLFHGRMSREGANAVGSDCGGAMTVHIAVYPSRPKLYLFGAGHVNRAIARAAENLGFELIIADTWLTNLNHPLLPRYCHHVHGESYTQIITNMHFDKSDYLIIATNSQDKEALDLLIHQDVHFLGLLASKRKVHHFRELMHKDGIPEEVIARLRSPIGLDIGAETPEEIAISVLAELLKEKNKSSGMVLNTLNQTRGFNPKDGEANINAEEQPALLLQHQRTAATAY